MAYLFFRLVGRAGAQGGAASGDYHVGDLVDVVLQAPAPRSLDLRDWLWVRCDDIPSPVVRGLCCEDDDGTRRRRFRLDAAVLVSLGGISSAWLNLAADPNRFPRPADIPIVPWSVLLGALRDKDDARLSRHPAEDRILEHRWGVEYRRCHEIAQREGLLTARAAATVIERDAYGQLRDAARALADADDAVRP